MSGLSPVFTKPGTALIAYLTVGYPSVEATLEIAPIIASSGCDIIELGIPFSDPLADGVTIQRAGSQALRQGVNPKLCLDVARKLRRRLDTPLVFMTYYNPVLSFGLDRFCQASAEAGIAGLIVPDLPPEEGVELEDVTLRHGLDLIYLLAPTSTDERIALVASRSRGFIYLVSVTGVTGPRDRLPEGLESFVSRVRQKSQQPLCVGFGISTPAEARRVAGVADGVIVGSRLIQLLEGEEPLTVVRSFIESLRQALAAAAKRPSSK